MTAGPPAEGSWRAEHPRAALAVRPLAGLAVGLLKLVRASWRVDVSEVARLDGYRAEGGPLIGIFWHEGYIALFPLLGGQPALVGTSRSLRGSVIAAISQSFGYRTTELRNEHRGSRILVKELSRPDGLIALAVDGPLGPRRQVKPGAVALAATTGARIVPLAAKVEGGLRLTKRWDKMMVPLPFSRVTVRVGEAIAVPPTDHAGIAEMAQTVGRALTAISD